MKQIVFFPTNNIGKYERYQRAFQRKGIDYQRYWIDAQGKEVKVEVPEDGKSLEENARKKAKAYYDAYKLIMPQTQFAVITTDEGLYIEGLENEQQPGMFVRRFNGLDADRATDQEVVARYTSLVGSRGGEVNAKWKYSLVMYDGKAFKDLTWQEPVRFSDTPHLPITKGYVLNNITIVRKERGQNIMLSDLSPEERDQYLARYTDVVANFVKENMERQLENCIEL